VASIFRATASANGTMSVLSARELEVLGLVGEGKTNRQIAEELYLSVRTVDRHPSRIFDKLGVSSRAAAASLLARSQPIEQTSETSDGSAQPPIGARGFAPQNTCDPIMPIRCTSTMLRIIDFAVAQPTPTGPPEAV